MTDEETSTNLTMAMAPVFPWECIRLRVQVEKVPLANGYQYSKNPYGDEM